MKSYKIAVLAGDGIGPEVMRESIKVLDAIASKHSLNFDFSYADAGGIAYDKHGTSLPKKTLEVCEKSDAILFGSVGGSKWDNLPYDEKIERVSILGLRKHFDFYANIRPVFLQSQMSGASPIKNVDSGFDMVIIRELSGDAYFGKKQLEEDFAVDEIKYTKHQCLRIAKAAFEMTKKRKNHVTCVDKSNVLSTSVFFRNCVKAVSKDYPSVKLDFMYVDNASMQLIKNPSGFDVLVTTNMFGDILSDEAAMIAASLGMLPSASINEKGFGLYEPAGGSAPDIAGKNIANPIAQILSAGMMFRHSFKMDEIADSIENAVRGAIIDGYRTKDIMQEGKKEVSTSKMGDLIAERVE